MRTIDTHKVNGCNEGLTIRVVDAPGPGGANHRYKIDGPTLTIGSASAPAFQADLRFQNGPIKEVGTNGITHESLLAVVADRLESFQAGPYACPENADALEHVRLAMAVLKARTEKRLARGVEGTHTV